MKLVTIERYYDVGRAEIARMKLESEGIAVLMHSMGHASLMGALPVGGIRVQVPESQAEEATLILEQLERDLSGDGGE